MKNDVMEEKEKINDVNFIFDMCVLKKETVLNA